MDRPDVTNPGVTLMHGDAGRLDLPDDSVDLIVTSPPYFGLRSYQDGGKHYEGQVGDEATPAEFIDALIRCTEEWVRVVKPSGSIWVNLGDKYARTGGGGRGSSDGHTGRGPRPSTTSGGAPEKSLIGIPWRYAIRCIDDLGLILRAEVIWSKPNGLPESVTDRVRRSHEQWFHFTLSPRYYSAVDEIREEHSEASIKRAMPHRANPGRRDAEVYQCANGQTLSLSQMNNPLGKLPGSVWTIATEPLHVPDELGVDHFAAFPTEWPRRIIQGWSPRGICTECGEGRRPVSERDPIDPRYLASNKRGDGRGHVEIRGVSQSSILRTGLQAGQSPATRITGEVCACPEPNAPTRPGVVLDPFGGTGTTALVASALGRHGISNDLSRDYLRIAAWRTSDPKQIAKAKREPFTPSQERIDGQLDILSMLEGEAF